MQGEAERALRCRPPSLPNRPHFDADSIDSAIPRPLGKSPTSRSTAGDGCDDVSSVQAKVQARGENSIVIGSLGRMKRATLACAASRARSSSSMLTR